MSGRGAPAAASLTVAPPRAPSALSQRGGGNRREIQVLTGVRLQFSRPDEFWPGTAERIMLLSGPLQSVVSALMLSISKLHTSQQRLLQQQQQQDGVQLPATLSTRDSLQLSTSGAGSTTTSAPPPHLLQQLTHQQHDGGLLQPPPPLQLVDHLNSLSLKDAVAAAASSGTPRTVSTADSALATMLPSSSGPSGAAAAAAAAAATAPSSHPSTGASDVPTVLPLGAEPTGPAADGSSSSAATTVSPQLLTAALMPAHPIQVRRLPGASHHLVLLPTSFSKPGLLFRCPELPSVVIRSGPTNL